MQRHCLAVAASLALACWLISPSIAQLGEAEQLDKRVNALLHAGKYAEAIPLAQRELAIYEKAFGPNHPDVATVLNNLALLHFSQGRYADAEPLLKRSLAIYEKAHGSDHPHVAVALNALAVLYRNQGRYADAEPLYKRSLAISEKALGPDHPDVARSLNNLALLYDHEGRYAEAEPLYKRSLAIREKALGPDHPDVAGSLNNLALLYDHEGRYAEAEPLYKRVAGDLGEGAGARSPRCRAIAEQSGIALRQRGPLRRGRAALQASRWRSGKRRSGPITPMSRPR